MTTVDAKKPEKARAEVRRRKELIAATIAEIGASGSLDVTVGKIAARAGMSPALAFHYFGGKEALFLAAMRQILKDFGAEAADALRGVTGARARVRGIVAASFSPHNFGHDSIAAWLNFYVLAQRSDGARRLLTLYRRRLASNLCYALRPSLGDRAPGAAKRIACMIDGLYLHAALDDLTTAAEAQAHVLTQLDQEMEHST
ncbi:transcriptional regulator BetI [Palleronia abyssalis]|uniref:HTH-type transcriptional regulator BetI n=1 Tax=Palleronia abyssalis TaxID=1501240 RepID=A0A2R8BTF3_9RHOB|nr:transcriptional regulator BetI [Palleronia abyssalis]SPJ23444.1 HTH-type transcriptional regulator BetI [Palleronia abyssalis]